MKYFICSLFLIASFSDDAQAKRQDTLLINASHVNTKKLIEGRHEWLVYTQPRGGTRKRFTLWQRLIEFSVYQGKEAITVKQVWEDNDSIVHTVETICNRQDFSTIYQTSWTKGQGTSEFNFLTREVKLNEKSITQADTSRSVKRLYDAFQKAINQYTLNWHLDLEVFTTLPYKEGRVFGINYYDPGFRAPRLVYYAVAGSAIIPAYSQMVDCWILTTQSSFSKQTFWISKKTQEVLKFQDESKDGIRYKVKIFG
jgi:hypothetical protein